MKRFSVYFNKKSRLIKVPQLVSRRDTRLNSLHANELKQRLTELLQVQNDFFPCFDWTFPPPVLQPASQPGSAADLLAESSVIPERFSLYLHTPFCKTLCKFCYYTVFPGKGIREAERYVDYLVREMQLYASYMQGKECESIYLGGGTPTYLDDKLLVKLLEKIRHHFNISADAEITIEAAPGTLPQSKVDLLKSLGINRLSYGIQTLDEQLLATMNRYYSVAESVRELDYAQQQIGNVNVDTMYGFEDESDSALLNTLKTFNQLGIPSLSIYALDKQRCESHAGEGPPIDVNYERKIRLFEQAKAYLDGEGYQAVLQNIFVKPGQASYKHQLRRWDNLTLLALGIASQGYAPRKPYQNAMTLKSYYQLLDENKPPIVTVDKLSPEMEMARELTSKLRFTEVPIDSFNRKYGIDLEQVYADLIQALNELGYLEKQDGSLRMTDAASYYNNIIPMLFAPDAFKQQLLALPEEYLEYYPIPNILTRVGETQSRQIHMHVAGQDTLPARERRQSNDRRLFQDTSYLVITGGIDRRSSVGRRVGDRQRYRSFVGDFLSS